MNTETTKMSLVELTALVLSLQEKIVALESLAEPKRNEAQREMTDADAQRIIAGDLADKKHNEAAKILGLSYGQIYSCRLEFTFKHVHKANKEANVVNKWAKA